MKLNGAAILIECLIEQNVGTVFGFPGGAVLPIYDELYKRQDRIQHVLTAHEQHAGHAADGYARASGKTGVCIATSGPGATNLVTPIATAYMDSSPVVFITGNVPQSLMGTDSFQEADISGMTMPVTKHNYLVTRVEKLADTIREAFYIAGSGRPGPVRTGCAGWRPHCAGRSARRAGARRPDTGPGPPPARRSHCPGR